MADEQNISLKTENSAGQVDYITMSKLGTVTKKIPASMEGSVHTANSRFLTRHPEGVDEFVSKKLDMSLEDMEKSFSPEQIDAIGISIDSLELGTPPILGDQTGIGKGRVLAGLAAYRILNGKKSTYITEHSTSFSDIYRELQSIGKADLIKPFIMKANDKSANIISESTGETLFEPMGSLEAKALAVLKHWPDGSELKAIEIKTPISDALTHAHANAGELGKNLPTLSSEDLTWLDEHRRGKHIFLNEGEGIPDSLVHVLDDAFKSDWKDGEQTFNPEGNFCLTTYSQFNRKGSLSDEEIEWRQKSKSKRAKEEFIPDDRAVWLEEMAKNDMALVADEIHSAGNIKSATGYNMSRVINAAWEKGNGVALGSATWSKDSDGIALFMPCFPVSIRNEELFETLKAGGVPMLEIFSRQLVSEGRMIRREHDINSSEFRVDFDEKNYGKNRDIVDSVAPILSDLGVLSGAINSRVALMNARNLQDEIARLGEKKGERAFQKNKVAMRNFSHTLNIIGEALDSSMRIDHTATLAIQALKEGRKPVIFLDKTMDSLMQSLVEEGRADERPDYKHVLHRLLDRIALKSSDTDIKDDKKSAIMARDPFKELQEEVFRHVLSSIPNEMKDVNGRGITDTTPDSEIQSIIDSNKEESIEALKKTGETSYTSYLNNLYQSTLEKTIASSKKSSLASLEKAFSGDELQKKIQDTEKAFDKYYTGLKSALLNKDGKMSLENTPEDLSEFLISFERNIPVNTGRLIESIRKKIDKMPELPVSAIDEIAQRIRDAGFSVDEITGRSTALDENGHIVTRSKETPRNVIKNNFNSGVIDAVIINPRGATAIDLHSSARFKDQRQREMIVHKAPLDIQKFTQGLGRVLRHDQVIKPIITYPINGMPCELVAIASQNKKLSNMSANTSGSRVDKAMVADVPDILNPVGDMVISEYISKRPDLKMRLGYDAHDEAQATKRGKEVNRTDVGTAIELVMSTTFTGKSKAFQERELSIIKKASSILQRISRMLPFKEQEKVTQEIVREYRARIEELDAQNRNPLKNKTIDGEVNVKSEYLLEGAPVNKDSVLWKDGYISEFDRPVYVQSVHIKTDEKMLQEDAVLELFEKGLAGMKEDNDTMANYIRDNKDILLRDYLPPKVNKVSDAVENGDVNVIDANNRIEHMANLIEQMKPGNSVNISVDGDEKQCIILSMKAPQNKSFKGSAAQYYVEVAIPGETKPHTYSLGSLMAQNVEPEIGLTGPNRDKLLNNFKNEVMNSVIDPRNILVGNEFACMALAVEHSLGTLINFKDSEGILRSGVLIPRSSNVLNALPVPMRNADISMKALETPLGGTGKVEMIAGRRLLKTAPSKIICKTSKQNTHEYIARIPTPKAKNTYALYKSESFNRFLDMYAKRIGNGDRYSFLNNPDFAKKNTQQFKDLTREEVEMLVNGYMEAGIGLDVDSASRSIVQKFEKEYYAERYGDAVERTEGQVVDKAKEVTSKQENDLSSELDLDDDFDGVSLTA